MSRREQRRYLTPRQQGLVLGRDQRLSAGESFKNLALVAPTGSGKTTRFVIPNVLLARGSVVVTDPSGEIFQKTSGHLHERGFQIQVIQPAHLSRSLQFNPLHYWKTPQQLRRLSTLLATAIAGEKSDPFWTTSAINVLFFSLSAITEMDAPQLVHLSNLRQLLNQLDTGGDKVDRFMARYLGSMDSSTLFSEYIAFRAMESRVRASVLATARAAIDLWSDDSVARLTADNTVDLHALRRRHTALYLILPEHQVGYFGLLANLFYSTCFQICLESGKNSDELPVFFILDEFGNLGYIHDIATVITTLRKRRCSVSIILQEMSQLRTVYGADQARTIFSGGAANKLFFSSLDLETAQYVEQALGSNTEYDTAFGGISANASTLSVPLMYADQIRRMRETEAILISGRQRPVRLEMEPYFQVRAWERMAEKVPFEIPQQSAAGTALSLLRW